MQPQANDFIFLIQPYYVCQTRHLGDQISKIHRALEGFGKVQSYIMQLQ